MICLVLVVLIGQVAANKAAEKRVDRFISSYDDYLDMEYDRVSMSLFTLDPTIQGITLTDAVLVQNSVTIGKMVLKDYAPDQKAVIPSELNIVLQDMRFPQTVFPPEERKKLQAMGYEQDLVLDVHLQFAYDKEKASFLLRPSTVHIHDCFQLRLSLQCEHVNFKDLGTYAFVYLMLPDKIPVALKELQLTYTDDSFFKRMVARQAKGQGLSVQEFVGQRKREIQDRLQAEKGRNSRKLLQALMQFIEEQRMFHLYARPNAPVPVGRAIELFSGEKTEELLDLFNVQFIAAQRK
jgi:hypothetical protein